MHIIKTLNSRGGVVLVSIILGLALASLFKKSCSDNNCKIIKGPPLKQVEGKVFTFDNKCYKYKAKATKCKIDSVKEIRNK
jgi:hypothetical protein